MYKRLINIPKEDTTSYFIFGPRGTGKTTWLKQHFPEACYIDLLDQAIYLDLHSNPDHLSRYFTKQHAWIIIDEVQKVPALLDEVHRLIESEKRQFVLTGSSARSLRKKGVNLLAGRALMLTMHPLTAIELGSTFDLAHALRYGQLPKVQSLKKPTNYLKSYVAAYLKEEVMQEGLTRNLQAFNRFLEAASFSHGCQINSSSIGRDVGVSYKTIDGYFNILEDLLIGKRLHLFTRRARRKLSQHPKFYYFDTGIYQTLRPRGPLDNQQEINGPALEGLLYQELLAINAYSAFNYEFYFWRTQMKEEVDFVAYGEHGLLAFEVKCAKKINKRDLKGLKLFKEDYPMTKCYLAYLGDHRLYIDDIEVIPMQELLQNLNNILANNHPSSD